MTEHGGSNSTVGGPAPRGRRASRALAWAAAALAALLVAAVLGGYAAYRHVFGEIRHVTITELGRRPPGYRNSLNILVIGSDTRSGQNRRFGAHISGQRSDTILVLHLSPGRRRAVVLSIPRDSVVPVLSCPAADGAPGQPARPGQVEQVNATFAAGGPGCLWKTIEQTTKIRLDHFMELNFTGFERVIDDLGGVTICLPYQVRDPRSRLRLSAGLHHVMGRQALAYWRVRYIGMGSDLQRIARDQYLMASLAQRIKRTDLLGDPPRLYRVVSDIAGSLTTDSGFSPGALISLARQVRDLPLRAVRFVQVPVTEYPPDPDWVRWSPQAHKLFRAIAADRGLPHPHGPGHRAATARPSPSRPAARSPSRPPAGPALSHLTSGYGGITAGANVCRDRGAFAGPLGGH